MSVHSRALMLSLTVGLSLLAGCGIPVSFWQNEVVRVDLPLQAPKNFSAGQDLNLSSNSSDLPVGSVSSVQIPEVKLSASNLGTDNTTTTMSGTLTVTDTTDASFAPVTIPFENLPVSDGGTLSVTPNPDDVTRLQPALLGSHPLHITYSASLDSVPADFQLTAAIHVVASISP